MRKVNSIVVAGIGGVGGYFGGKIAHNIEKTGNKEFQVHFIARGEHFEVIKEQGLRLNMADQSVMNCKPQSIADNFDEITDFNILFLAVKSYDLDFILEKIGPKIKDDTIILPLLNGIDIYERIRKKIKSGIVLPSCVYISSHIEKPGVIRHRSGKELIILGPDPQRKNNDVSILLKAFQKFGINYKWSEDIELAIWEKFIFISSYGMVTALYDKTVGEVFSDSNLKETTRKIMCEIYNLGKARNIPFDENTIENALNIAKVIPTDTRTSYQLDVIKKGNKNESNIYAGTILRMSEETGINTPVTKNIYEKILKMIEDKSSMPGQRARQNS